MRVTRKSDIADLVAYITGQQDKQERVGHVKITNCESLDAGAAALEMQAIQLQNTRSRADKTYHLLISFRAGEDPSVEQLIAIEQAFCKALGFEDHQRVSAAHYDTDNVHLHVAINKVHPARLTVHTPFYDRIKLAETCVQVEQEFGLEVDNHQFLNRGSEAPALDMESHSGQESLLTWVRRECLDSIRSANTWEAVHAALQEHGLALARRGNGLVIGDADGTFVKASSVARDLGLQQLEKRLGPLEAGDPAPGSAPRKRYQKQPRGFRINTTELYAEYQRERQEATSTRKELRHLVRSEYVEELKSIRATNALRRAAIRLAGGDRMSRRISYAMASKALKQDLARARGRSSAARRAIGSTHRGLTWADWLAERAGTGDTRAFEAMRARATVQARAANTLLFGERGAAPLDAELDSVTKHGTQIYRIGDAVVRDRGTALHVSRAKDLRALHAVVAHASSRFGSRLHVEGSQDFKTRVVAIAAAMPTQFEFDDPAMQREYQRLLNLRKDLSNDRKNTRGADGRGDAARRPAAAAQRFSVNDSAERDLSGVAGRGGSSARPAAAYSSAVGRERPPEAKDRLRNLSVLPLVEDASGRSVLLQGDAHGELAQQEAPVDRTVRRPVHTSELAAAQAAAVGKLIAERNGKRATIADIPKHSQYTQDPSSSIYYAGLRLVDGVDLALVKRGVEIEVLAVDSATANKLRRLRRGDEIELNAAGKLTRKGRAR